MFVAAIRLLAGIGLCVALSAPVVSHGSAPLCTPGRFSATGFEPCQPCAPGSVAPFAGQTACDLCPVGFFQSNAGEIDCIECPLGRFADAPGSTSCDECPAGSFANQTATGTCVPCAAGSFAAGTGSSVCTQCAAGSYSSDGAIDCTPCEPGRATPVPGSASCAPCVEGSFAAGTGNIECNPCGAGSSSGAESASCQPCAPGTFAPFDRSPSCSDCPGGFAQPQAGQTTCSRCQAGTYQPGPAGTACLACPTNTYAPLTESTFCFACSCNDQTACTRDSCDAATAECNATPVTSCSPRTIEFSGTVTSLDPELDTCFSVGEPLGGSFTFDPEAPDTTPLDAARGIYAALQAFEMRAGPATSEAVFSGSGGTISLFDNIPLGADTIDVDPSGAGNAGACGTPSQALLRLSDPAGTSFSETALAIDADTLGEFPGALARLVLTSGLDAYELQSTDLSFVPEPGTSVAAFAAIGSLASLGRARMKRVGASKSARDRINRVPGLPSPPRHA